jgi:hypothetical protein
MHNSPDPPDPLKLSPSLTFFRHTGTDWKGAMVLTATFLPATALGVLACLNFIAYTYTSLLNFHAVLTNFVVAN